MIVKRRLPELTVDRDLSLSMQSLALSSVNDEASGQVSKS